MGPGTNRMHPVRWQNASHNLRMTQHVVRIMAEVLACLF